MGNIIHHSNSRWTLPKSSGLPSKRFFPSKRTKSKKQDAGSGSSFFLFPRPLSIAGLAVRGPPGVRLAPGLPFCQIQLSPMIKRLLTEINAARGSFPFPRAWSVISLSFYTRSAPAPHRSLRSCTPGRSPRWRRCRSTCLPPARFPADSPDMWRCRPGI